MSDSERMKLYERVLETIRQTQRELYIRKAKLGEPVVIVTSKDARLSSPSKSPLPAWTPARKKIILRVTAVIRCVHLGAVRGILWLKT